VASVLDRNDILRIHTEAIQAGLASKREQLFYGLDRRYIARLAGSLKGSERVFAFAERLPVGTIAALSQMPMIDPQLADQLSAGCIRERRAQAGKR